MDIELPILRPSDYSIPDYSILNRSYYKLLLSMIA